MVSQEESRWQRHLQQEFVDYEHYDRMCSDKMDNTMDRTDSPRHSSVDPKKKDKQKKEKKDKKKKKNDSRMPPTTTEFANVTYFKSRSEKEAEAKELVEQASEKSQRVEGDKSGGSPIASAQEGAITQDDTTDPAPNNGAQNTFTWSDELKWATLMNQVHEITVAKGVFRGANQLTKAWKTTFHENLNFPVKGPDGTRLQLWPFIHAMVKEGVVRVENRTDIFPSDNDWQEIVENSPGLRVLQDVDQCDEVLKGIDGELEKLKRQLKEKRKELREREQEVTSIHTANRLHGGMQNRIQVQQTEQKRNQVATIVSEWEQQLSALQSDESKVKRLRAQKLDGTTTNMALAFASLSFKPTAASVLTPGLATAQNLVAAPSGETPTVVPVVEDKVVLTATEGVEAAKAFEEDFM